MQGTESGGSPDQGVYDSNGLLFNGTYPEKKNGSVIRSNTPVSSRRAIATAISCIVSSADIFPGVFDLITEPFFLRVRDIK